MAKIHKWSEKNSYNENCEVKNTKCHIVNVVDIRKSSAGFCFTFPSVPLIDINIAVAFKLRTHRTRTH